jgi:DNA-binding MarR family transcriptional regulator
MAKDSQNNELKMYLQSISAKAINKFVEDNGLEDILDNYQMSIQMKDVSKTKWKSKSHFIKVYEQELLKLMTKKVIDIEMLGFLTLLSLYLNFEDNCLINKDGTYLNQKDIIELTGWSKPKVNKFIKEAIDSELMYEKKQEIDKRKSKYYLNPHLFFKGQMIAKETKDHYNKEK